MTRTMRMAILLGVLCFSPLIGHGQSHDFPILNSIGRYFGAGYTLGGYHSIANGRLHDGTIPQIGPASHYRTTGPNLRPIESAWSGGPQQVMAPHTNAFGSCGCGQTPGIPMPVNALPMNGIAPSPAPALDEIEETKESAAPESREQLPPPAEMGLPIDPESSPSDRRIQEQAASQQDWPIAYRAFPPLASFRNNQPPRQPPLVQESSIRELQMPATVQVNRYQQAKLGPSPSAR
jgi:hypothetical protein